MKNKFKLILQTSLLASVLVFTAGACKSKSKSTQTIDSTGSCRVFVDFGSYGSGINQEKFDELITFLKEKKISYTEKTKGREGERELCISLKEYKGSDKQAMEEWLKKFEDNNTLISVSIN